MFRICKISFFLLLLVRFLVPAVNCFSQSYNFKNYSAEQGLPSLKVDAIYQDSKGYLWVGGYGGLSKFDGKIFIANYSPKKNGLANQHVTSIAEDSNGNIWAGTTGGLSRFDGSAFFNFKRKDGLVGENITSIAKDKDGRLWIGTTQGISVYDGKSFESLTTKNGLISDSVSMIYVGKSGAIWIVTDRGPGKLIFENKPQQDKLADNYHFADIRFTEALGKVTSITEDDNGYTWFGTDSGAVKYDGIKFIMYTVREGLLENGIRSLSKDERSNAIWLGTSNGLNRISANDKIEAFRVSSASNGNDIRKLLTDVEGNLWIGTENGVYRFRDPSFYTFSVQGGLKDSQINFIFRDSKKNLWVGTEKEGVYMYSSSDVPRTSSYLVRNFSESDGLSGTATNACMEDKAGNIWIGTSKGVFQFNGKTFLKFNEKINGVHDYEVTAVMQDRRDRIWLGVNNTVTIWDKGSLTTHELESDESRLKVYCEFEDSKRNIWLGTRSGELYLYDGRDYINFSRKLNMEGKTYFAILEDKEGVLYFGSLYGVYVYDPSGKILPSGTQLALISEKDGLSSDIVFAMSFDAAGDNLYIGTNQGLNKFNVKEFKKSGKINLRQYGQEEGLHSLDFNPNGIWREEDGTFWLGTTNGLVRFNPHAFRENYVESKTSITKISLFYEDTLLAPDSKLPHDLNNISFEYIGICLTNPERVRYKFMLEGYDKEWSPETKETFARYSNLAANKYMFKVVSCNSEGIWNKDPVSFSFEILPPVWKTWWFRITVSLAAILFILIFSKLRAEAIRKKEAEKLSREIQLANNELKALRAQMDPHFIFNSLSSIQSFIMTKDEDSALRYLNKFAKLMRTILSNSEKASVTIGEEIESLKLYLELEVLRWDKKFDYSIIIDSGIETDFHKIPSMLIQPYVENAILHGLVPRKEGRGKVDINITQNDTHIICAISDNGIGRQKSHELRTKSNQATHESMGMKITSDRLEVLNRIHHSDLNVKITDLLDDSGNSSGTKVEIFIPRS